jgi:hypothetical protein
MSGRDLHIDFPLTNLTIGYRPIGLIADKIYPIVTVGNATGIYFIWNKTNFLSAADAVRAPGAEANRVNMEVSSDGFAIKNYALASDIPYEFIANADAALHLRESTGNFLMDQQALSWEGRLATILTTTTNMCSSTVLTNNWSDPVLGTPIDDIYAGRDAIRKGTGMTPNKMVMGDHAWSRFSRHPDIIEFVRGRGDNRGGGPVGESDIARAFGLEEVLVGKGIKNTAPEGATGVYTDIWSTACILLYVAPSPGLMTPSHGYTFRWTPEGFPGPMAIERYQNIRPKTESVETHIFQDEKVTGTDLGYLITGC